MHRINVEYATKRVSELLRPHICREEHHIPIYVSLRYLETMPIDQETPQKKPKHGSRWEGSEREGRRG